MRGFYQKTCQTLRDTTSTCNRTSLGLGIRLVSFGLKHSAFIHGLWSLVSVYKAFISLLKVESSVYVIR